MPEKKLTMKQKKFVKGISEGKPATVSALEAYDTNSYKTAAVIASENINKPNVKAAIELAMEKHGLTMDRIIAPVDKALRATHKIKTESGDVVDTGVDDLEMQLKGHDRAVKLVQIANKEDKPEGNTFNFNFKGNASFDMGKYKK